MSMKKYMMLPVLMVCFMFSNNVTLASNSAHKYLSSNYSSSGKTKKNKVSKKKAKPSAKAAKKSPKVAKVGKKYGRPIASVSKSKAKKKNNRSNY